MGRMARRQPLYRRLHGVCARRLCGVARVPGKAGVGVTTLPSLSEGRTYGLPCARPRRRRR